MRTLIVGKSGKDSLEQNLIDVASSDFGDNAVLIDFPNLPKLVSKDRRLHFLFLNIAKMKIINNFLSRKLLKTARIFDPHLVVVLTGATDYLTPETMEKLKKIVRGRIVCWFVDASVNLGSARMLFANYDHYYFADRGLLNWFTPFLKDKASLLMEGYHPYRHVSSEITVRNTDIAIVGSLYPARILMLEELVKLGFNIKIYGPGLPSWYGNGILSNRFQGEYLIYESKIRVFDEALCVLNNFHPSHIDIINCRIFEVLASSGLLVSERSELLREVFGENNILTYSTFSELVTILTQIVSGEIDVEHFRRNNSELRRSHSLTDRYRELKLTMPSS